MDYLLAALLLLPAVFIAFNNWRYGLFACVVVAILQDPLRKLAPGEPVYYILLTGVVFGAAFLAAWGRVSLDPNRIAGWRRNLSAPFNLFLLLLAAQAVNAYLQFGSPILVGIGLLSYLAPLPALVLGYHYAKRSGIRGIERWLWFYLVGDFPCSDQRLSGIRRVFLAGVRRGGARDRHLRPQSGALHRSQLRHVPGVRSRRLARWHGGLHPVPGRHGTTPDDPAYSDRLRAAGVSGGDWSADRTAQDASRDRNFPEHLPIPGGDIPQGGPQAGSGCCLVWGAELHRCGRLARTGSRRKNATTPATNSRSPI